MSITPNDPARFPTGNWFRLPIVIAVGLIACVGLAYFMSGGNRLDTIHAAQGEDQPAAPELDGGLAWLNTAGPLKMKDLKGKIVILDFWTLCCINCIHTIPDLAKLEKKYSKELVVIGVHSPKFDSERETKNIKQAILRYEISHPIVNDADMKIWRAYDVHSWPTLVVIDPEGKYLGAISGEGNFERLDRVIAKLIEIHKEKKTLNETPMRFDLVRFREKGDSPLFFPGKIHADAKNKRLFIADSTHHRIVVTDMDGKKLAIIGTGVAGNKDGSFEEAQFDDPQGMALDGETLYVADRKNHLIRAIDLKARTVKRVAGVGEQVRDRSDGGNALETGLNSPWALLMHNNKLFIAMAGHHQIWTLDPKNQLLAPYAGDGRENIKDGPLFAARFAQPSGLTTDGTNLFVADSEVSAIRQLPLNGEGRVTTLIGEGLFEFGDIDGTGDEVRIQHALGVQYVDGLIYIADTYNNKIKTLDPKTRVCKTFLGDEKPNVKDPMFNEPAGLSYADGKLYVADTNANRIRVIDLKSKAVTTLTLKDVSAPVMPKE